MTVDFDLGEEARIVEANWQALETLVHTVPLTEGVAPEATVWAGSRTGRLIELSFDPVSLVLQTTPVQQSCLRLQWSGDNLQRLPDIENVCAATFPGLAKVEPLAETVVAPGRKAYRMTLELGVRQQYPEGLNAWCARLRVRGLCPHSGQELHSPEVAVRAMLMLPTPPPAVTQPPIEALPLSTYPDALGTSYFGIDLRDLLGSDDQSSDTLVKVYLGRLEALTDQPEQFVQGETVIDPPGLIALAKQLRGRFSLVSDPPEAFDANRPHVDIAVPGDIFEVYIAAVLGADGLLETGRWQDAVFLPFRTPPRRSLPHVDWISAGVEATEGNIEGDFTVAARFPAPMPDPSRPPILHLFRRNLSIGETQARFVTSAEGQSEDPSADSPGYTFELDDSPLEDWHRYEYAVQLLDFAPWRGQHVKVGERVLRQVAALLGGLRDPFVVPTPVTVVANPAGGFVIEADFTAGDFTVELEKEPDQGTATTWRGRIEAGQLFLPDGITGTLKTGPAYDLHLTDPDPAPGLYRVRLRFGQSLTVSREARTP